MRNAQQLSATTDYQTTMRVKASPDALFDALTTVAGLAAWWNPATRLAGTGGRVGPSPTAPSSPTGKERGPHSPSPRSTAKRPSSTSATTA